MVDWDVLDWRIQGSTCGQGRLVPTDFWNGQKLELLSSKRCSLLLTPFSMATFVDGVGVFLVTTADGLFSIDLDSDRATKVCEGREINNQPVRLAGSYRCWFVYVREKYYWLVM